MLESLAAGILNRFLGAYVKNFDAGKLKIAIWSGNVKLEKLELKDNILDTLNLPLRLKEGHLRELTLAIPWSDLRNKPVEICINDLFLSICLDEDFRYKDKDSCSKLKRLENLEESFKKGIFPEEEKKNKGFLESAITKIIDNIQIKINKIRIHYELEVERSTVTVGLLLNSFNIISCNPEPLANWDELVDTIHKSVILDSLSLYCDRKSNGINALSLDIPSHDWILRPVTGKGKLELRKFPEQSAFKFDGTFKFEDLSISILDDQYVQLILMYDLIHEEVTKKTQTASSIFTKYNATNGKEKFKSVVNSIISQVREERIHWSWSNIKENCKDRRKYIELYIRILSSGSLSPKEKEDFDNIQFKFPFEVLRCFRLIGRSKFKLRSPGTSSEKTKEKGWISWALNFAQLNSYFDYNFDDQRNGLTITEQEKAELFETFNFNDETLDEETFLSSFRAQLILEGGSFVLKRSNADLYVDRHLLLLNFKNFSALLKQKNGSWNLKLSLEDLDAFDGSPSNKLFPNVIRSSADKNKDVSNLFDLNLSNGTEASNFDYSLRLNLLPMEIIIHLKGIKEIMEFFQPIETQRESIQAMIRAAEEKMSKFREYTKNSLLNALELRKRLKLACDIQAPLLTFPESCTESLSGMVIDCGHIRIDSDLAEERDIGDLKNSLEHCNLQKLNKFAYDRFKFDIKKLQILGIKELKFSNGKIDLTESLSIIDKTNIGFLLESSIIPENYEIEKFRISGNLPVLSLQFSELKLKLVKRIFESNIMASSSHAENVEESDIMASSSHAENVEETSTSSITNNLYSITKENESHSSENEEISQTKNLFSFKFKIGKVCILVADEKEQGFLKYKDLYFEVEISEVGLLFNSYTTFSRMRLVLASITVYENSPNLGRREILSTKAVGHLEDKNFIEAKAFLSDSTKKDYKVTMQKLTTVFELEMLLGLFRFIAETFPNVMESLVRSHSKNYESEKEVLADAKGTRSSCPYRVEVILINLSIVLRENGSDLASLILSRLKYENINDIEMECANIIVEKISLLQGRTLEDTEISAAAFAEIDSTMPFFLENFQLTIRKTIRKANEHRIFYCRSNGIFFCYNENLILSLVNYIVQLKRAFTKFGVIGQEELSKNMSSDQIARAQDKNPLLNMEFDVLVNDFRIQAKSVYDQLLTFEFSYLKIGTICNDNEVGLKSLKRSITCRVDELDFHFRNRFKKESMLSIMRKDYIELSVEVEAKIDGFKMILKCFLDEIDFFLNMEEFNFLKYLKESIDLVGNINMNSGTNGRNPYQKSLTSAEDVHSNEIYGELLNSNLSFTFFNDYGKKVSIARMKTKGFKFCYSKVASALKIDCKLDTLSLDNPSARNYGDRCIIPIDDKQKNLLMVSIEISNGVQPVTLIVATVDRLKINVSYIFLEELTKIWRATNESHSINRLPQSKIRKQSEDFQNLETFHYRLDLIEGSIYFPAKSTFQTKELYIVQFHRISITQQSALAFNIEQFGLFSASRSSQYDMMRILDDVNVTAASEKRVEEDKLSVTNCQIELSQFLFKLSLKDIIHLKLIIIELQQLATKLSSVEDKNKSGSQSHDLQLSQTPEYVQSRKFFGEQMVVQINGLRVVIIEDRNELPFLEFSIQPFSIRISDWSTDFSAETKPTVFVETYDFSKSHWEPLIEPWQFGFHISRKYATKTDSIMFFSRKKMEMNLTSNTLLNFEDLSNRLNASNEKFLSSECRTTAPYRIRNLTGLDFFVWVDDKCENGSSKYVADGQEIRWEFEAWKSIRETKSLEPKNNKIALKFLDSPWEALKDICVGKEGISFYPLRPKLDVLHRIAVEVRLVNKRIKMIIVRSLLKVVNRCKINIETVLCDDEGNPKSEVYKIVPESFCALPIESSYKYALRIRPDPVLGYTWSQKTISWRSMRNLYSTKLLCKAQYNSLPAFNFYASAEFDENNPLSHVYPMMSIIISPPIRVENLLPYDLHVRIIDKATELDTTEDLQLGSSISNHLFDVSNTLLLSISSRDSALKSSQYAIIQTDSPEEFKREDSLEVKSFNNMRLSLGLYYKLVNGSRAFALSIITPYIILNKSGIELQIISKEKFQKKSSEIAIIPANSRPTMFSYEKSNPKNRALIRATDSHWSDELSLEAIGSAVDVPLEMKSNKNTLTLGVSITEGKSKYKLTKIITIAPRFLLQNRLPYNMVAREPDYHEILSIPTGKQLIPLLQMKNLNDKQLCLRFDDDLCQWSAPFYINDLGRLHVKLGHATKTQILLKVDIVLQDATIFIILSEETNKWPYSIVNETDETLHFWQSDPNAEDDDEIGKKRLDERYETNLYKLPSRTSMPYSWDLPAAANKELVLSCRNKSRLIRLSEIGSQIPLKISLPDGTKKVLSIDVIGDGPSQIVSIKNKCSHISKKDEDVEKKHIEEQNIINDDGSAKIRLYLDLEGISISLINKKNDELAYCTFLGIHLKYSHSASLRIITTTVRWIQIDNQLYGGIFPIVMYPSVVPNSISDSTLHPVFSASITQSEDKSYGVVFIKYASALLQEITIEIDEDFLFALLDFLKSSDDSIEDEIEEATFEEISLPIMPRKDAEPDLYFELLHLQPIKINLSFMRTERVNVQEKISSKNPLMFFLNILTMAIGNINDAPVKLNALLIENIRSTSSVLREHVINHYGQEFIYQIHKILGSADFLGNPVGLFNSISSGVADIFYEPYQGFIMSDRAEDLGIGLAKGTASFVKKTVFSLTDSVSKVTGSISKGLSFATLDKKFQDDRRVSRTRNKPNHALYGVTTGANSLFEGFASGLEGMARQPIEGYKVDGTSGFFRGVGKGFIGLATKPLIGILDMAGNVSEGIKNTTLVFDNNKIEKIRLPRHTDQSGIITIYSRREALGQYWLKQSENGKYFADHYLAHINLDSDYVLLITYERILLINLTKLKAEKEIFLHDLQSVQKEGNGVLFVLKGGIKNSYVEIPSYSARRFVFSKLRIAVDNYNRANSPLI